MIFGHPVANFFRIRLLNEKHPHENNRETLGLFHTSIFSLAYAQSELLQRFFIGIQKSRAEVCGAASVYHSATHHVWALFEREAF